MAQVMRYWQHPIYPTHSLYDWCNMPIRLCKYKDCDYYSNILNANFDVEQQAIAKLIYDCGTKANMNYCIGEVWETEEKPKCETFGWPDNIRDALVNSFGYHSDASVDRRQYYSQKKWKEKLINDLENGRPIIYSALSPEMETFLAGHTFIIDGYRETDDKFHINWGWGGDGGWFTVDHFGEYTWKERGIFNLYPEWTLPACNSSVTLINCGVTFDDPLYPYSPYPSYIFCNQAVGSLYYENDSWRVNFNDILAGTITANNVTIPNYADIHFKAYDQIILENSFVVEGNFIAEIIDCPVPCDNSKRLMYSTGRPYTEEHLTNFYDYNEEKTTNNAKQQDSSIFEIRPNPFINSLEFVFYIPEQTNVKIIITNIYGQNIMTIYNDKIMEGQHSIVANTSTLPQGIYFCVFVTPTARKVLKVIKNE